MAATMPGAGIPAAVIAELIGDVKDVSYIRYSALAGLSVVIWDHFATFDQEVRHIWPARWSFGKVIFFINRYYTLFSVIYNNIGLLRQDVTDQVIVSEVPDRLSLSLIKWSTPSLRCLNFFRWQAATGVISVLVAQVTLQLRVYAIYNLDKRIIAFVGLAFVAAIASAITIHIKAFWNATATSTAIPGIPFCVPIGFPPNYWTVWISILGFEVLLLGLALYRAFTGGLPEALDSPSSEHRSPWRTRAQRPWKNTKRVARVFRRTERIIDILIRDSILYFVVMFAAYLANLLVWYIGTVNTYDLPIAFSDSFSCVMCSRMLLNVHTLPRDGPETIIATIGQPTTAAGEALEMPRVLRIAAPRPPHGEVDVDVEVDSYIEPELKPGDLEAPPLPDEQDLSPEEMRRLRRLRASR